MPCIQRMKVIRDQQTMTEKNKIHPHFRHGTPPTKSPFEWSTQAARQEFAQGWEKSRQNLDPYILIIDHRTDQSEQSELKAMETLLSKEEKQRLNSYRTENTRKNYLERTALLRQILGITINQKASELRFERNRSGKPHLKSIESIKFNMSHSKGMTLIGIHPKLNIGVDIEKINLNINWKSIAERWFPIDINNKLNVLPTDQQAREFFSLWCRFEAVLKCDGKGLANLDSSNLLLKEAVQSATMITTQDEYKAAIAIENHIN